MAGMGAINFFVKKLTVRPYAVVVFVANQIIGRALPITNSQIDYANGVAWTRNWQQIMKITTGLCIF